MTYPPQPQAFGHPAHRAPIPQATPAAPGAPTAPTTPAASAPMRVVEARGLTKVYGEGEARVVALDSASLVVGRGEFVAIMGPSGSGKSTLLHCLAGLDTPTSGSVLIAGQDLSGMKDKQLTAVRRDRLGFIFQSFNLLPTLSAEENILLPQRLAHRKPQRDWYDAVISTLGIGDRLSHRPHELSGGQQQRVALARALVFEPQLVLMDEPLGALDKQLREHMQMEIKHIHERLGVTVVYVTHDQGEALTMSDRVAVFHQGEIQQIAPPRELYEFPRNTFVANFIGENNRLNGKLLSREGDRCTVALARGEKVEALAVNVGEPGEPVTLSIRPERVRLNGTSENCANRFSGRVVEFIYLGDHVRIRLEVCGNADFFVKQPIAELDPSLAVGDVLPLGWHVEHVRALDPLAAE